MSNKNLDTIIIHHKPISDIMLKRLLLIFDHIHFINPKENHYLIPRDVAKINYSNGKTTMGVTLSDYAILYNSDVYEKTEEQLIDRFDYAYKKNLIQIIDLKAKRFYEKYWLPLRLSYDFDTANNSLLELTSKLLEKNPDATTDNGLIRGCFIEPSGIKIYPDIPEVPKIFPEEENKIYKYDIQAYSAIGKLDRSMAVCGAYDLIPSIIDPIIAKMFMRKYEIAKNNPENNLKMEFQKKYNIPLLNVQHLLYKISETILPDDILQQIPVKELIIARNNTMQDLYGLRRKLLGSIKYLVKYECESNFVEQAEKYVSKVIEPQLKGYYSKLWEYMAKFTNYTSTFAFASLAATIGVVQSLTPMETAFFSGISAMVGSASSNLPDYLIRKDKDRFKNTYAYFLNFRD